jgi:hypothetical protein
MPTMNRLRCSPRETENHSLISWIPLSTSICSKRTLAQELPVLLVGGVAHDPLDAGAVVPGAVEEHDLAGGRCP